MGACFVEIRRLPPAAPFFEFASAFCPRLRGRQDRFAAFTRKGKLSEGDRPPSRAPLRAGSWDAALPGAAQAESPAGQVNIRPKDIGASRRSDPLLSEQTGLKPPAATNRPVRGAGMSAASALPVPRAATLEADPLRDTPPGSTPELRPSTPPSHSKTSASSRSGRLDKSHTTHRSPGTRPGCRTPWS